MPTPKISATPSLPSTAMHISTSTPTPAVPEVQPQKPITPTSTPEGPHFASHDGRIEFALDQVERTKVWPTEIQGARIPREGHEFVVIHVAIARIGGGHVNPTRGSVVVGSDGVEYPEAGWVWQGMKFNDSRSLSSGELAEGAEATLLFELPEKVQPTALKLAYLFFESWSESWQPESPEERYTDIHLK